MADEPLPDQPTLRQTAVAAVAALVFVGGMSWLGGRQIREAEARAEAEAAAPKPKPAPIQVDPPTEEIPAGKKTIPNSLGYLGSDDDGLTAEERAAIAAEEAEEERLAAEEERLAAEAEAARLAAEKAAAEKAAPEAAKTAAAPSGPVDFDGRGKTLASSAAAPAPAKAAKPVPAAGVPLNGGTGLASGMTRSFDSKNLSSTKP